MAADRSCGMNFTSPPPKKLECPICYELFRDPKCLPCGHSLCADCCKHTGLLSTNCIKSCPVCRQKITIPVEGLPTNFSLQDAIQDYRGSGGQYRCVDCGRSCSADGTFVLDPKKFGSGGDMKPRCFRCAVRQYGGAAAGGDGTTNLSDNLESVPDLLERYGTELSEVKRVFQETIARKQHERAELLRETVRDIRKASDKMSKEADKLDFEIHTTEAEINSILALVPHASLDELNAFNESIEKLSAKLTPLTPKGGRVYGKGGIYTTVLAPRLLNMWLECLAEPSRLSFIKVFEDNAEKENGNEKRNFALLSRSLPDLSILEACTKCKQVCIGCKQLKPG